MNLERPQLNNLRALLRLKEVIRKGWTRHPVPSGAVESVADHSWGLTLLAWFLCPPELRRERVVELALLHDLAEVKIGDITPHDGVSQEEKVSLEERAERELFEGLPKEDRALELLEEYRAQSTPEARWVKALDKLEMSLQSLNYEEDYSLELSEFRESARPYLETLLIAES